MHFVFLNRLRALAFCSLCLTTTGLIAQEVPLTDWKTANDTVGRFVRGHVDLLRWEQANPIASPGQARTASAPPVDLNLETVLTQSLAMRPDLFARPGMGAQELRALDAEWAAWRQGVERAWIDAALSLRVLDLKQRSLEGSEAAAELANRMAAVGNWSQAQRQQQTLELQRAQADTAQARLAADHAWRGLATLIGADSGAQGTGHTSASPSLAALPDLATWPFWQTSATDMERLALERHPGWSGLNAEGQRLQRGAGAAQWALWQAYAAQAARASLQRGQAPRIEPRQIPWSHSLEKAVETQAEATALEARLRDAVRSARAQLLTAHALAQQAQSRLGVQTALEQDTVLRYNGMFKSTWELIAAAQARLAAEAEAQQALADFWRSHADLQALLGGAPYNGPGGLAAGASASAPPKGH